MNSSCINQHIKVYAERSIILINNYTKTMYTPDFIDNFRSNCYFKLKSILSAFNFAIKGETCFDYFNILHIYVFIKSQVLASYQEITLTQIEDKLINQFPITLDEFIGVYIYSINNDIIDSYYKVLLTEYKIKAHFQSNLIDKVKFKQLIHDYHENHEEYKNNNLDKLLGNRELSRYLSEFI